jgi:hypothetical protein
VLSKLSDVEKLLWLCMSVPNFKNERKTAETLTNYILLLKNTLEALPQLSDVLSQIEYPYFNKIAEVSIL